jgi:hypothetical protein
VDAGFALWLNYLLYVGGEALRLVLCQSLGLVPLGHFCYGLLEEFSQFQLSSQTLLLLLFLKEKKGRKREREKSFLKWSSCIN